MYWSLSYEHDDVVPTLVNDLLSGKLYTYLLNNHVQLKKLVDSPVKKYQRILSRVNVGASDTKGGIVSILVQ